MQRISLLIGINYINTDIELIGCINDVNNISEVLKNKFSFSEIIKLTDKTRLKPTKQNIIDNFNLILEKINSSKYNEIWIHYSGHGYRINDKTSKNNYSEVIIPLDYKTKGVISNDFFYEKFLKKIKNPNVKIFIFFDCCNSGTQMALPYQYNNNHWIKKNDNHCIGKVIFMSGCKNNQDSQEIFNIENNKKWAGAMTTNFINWLDKLDYHVKINDLMIFIQKFIESSKFKQTPQISSNYKINMNALLFYNTNNNCELLQSNLINNEETIKSYIHLYKRYEYLGRKYKNIDRFYNYYRKQKKLYNNLIENFEFNKINNNYKNSQVIYFFKTQLLQ